MFYTIGPASERSAESICCQMQILSSCMTHNLLQKPNEVTSSIINWAPVRHNPHPQDSSATHVSESILCIAKKYYMRAHACGGLGMHFSRSAKSRAEDAVVIYGSLHPSKGLVIGEWARSVIGSDFYSKCIKGKLHFGC